MLYKFNLFIFFISILNKIEIKNKFKRISIILYTHQQMDLNQRKLNKSEWDSIEVPVSKSEK